MTRVVCVARIRRPLARKQARVIWAVPRQSHVSSPRLQTLPLRARRRSALRAQMQASQAELQAAKIDLAYRDFCAHLLVPLNECRRANFWLPWTCKHEKHVYEACEYKEYMKRVAKMKELRD